MEIHKASFVKIVSVFNVYPLCAAAIGEIRFVAGGDYNLLSGKIFKNIIFSASVKLGENVVKKENVLSKLT